MYKQKSEIITRIQSYHKQVAELYIEIYNKTKDENIKKMVFDLYEHEKYRENYLERHKKIAKVINCWLEFPCEKLKKQINNCFENLNNLDSNITIEKIIEIELYFDNCLIKLYNILASENELNESLANIFYYMLKKTKKEENTLAKMLHNSKKNLELNSNTFEVLIDL